MTKFIGPADHRRSLANFKIELCASLIAEDQANLIEDPKEGPTYRRFIEQAREDARYWVVEAWLLGPSFPDHEAMGAELARIEGRAR